MGQDHGKSGRQPAFSPKSKETFPKTEVLGKPLFLGKWCLLSKGVYREIKNQINRYYYRHDAGNNYSHIDDTALPGQNSAKRGCGRKPGKPYGTPCFRSYGEVAAVL
jgi:hypothetical protein